jgi:CDP-glycerol glycerophosphotransferase (TagB/SpsB family)
MLQGPEENERLIESVVAATRQVSADLVFKPHPFFPAEDLLADLEVDHQVADPDTSLAELIAGADVCLSIYSTATFPALIRATPVVWLPFAGENHVFVDLIDEVGVRVDGTEELADELEALRDPDRYRSVAEQCQRYATDALYPSTDRRLGDVVLDLSSRASNT